MTKSILTVITVCVLSSCAKEKDIFDTATKERVNNCITTETFQVPVKEGYTTYVTYGDDTLAVASTPITILVPKQSVSTKSTALKIDYAILKTNYTYSKYWQAVMFEDTESGDYDYNDLVIHVKNFCNYPYNKDYSLQTIELHPIALGSEKTIKLGCLLGPDLKEEIISEDVRRDLFNGQKGLINTISTREPIRYKLASTGITNYRIEAAKAIATIAWFIEVDGKRYYAVSADLNYQDYNMLNAEGMPYGLVIANNNGTFSYPEEKTSILNAYPDFQGWIKGQKDNIGSNIKSLIYKYCSGGIPGENGKNHKIWDYEDLK